MMHTNVFKQVIHFCYHLLDDELQALVQVIGVFFDDIDADINAVLIDMYPATVTISGMLPDYERYYRCTVQGGDALETRINRVLAKIRAKGGLGRSYFYRIAAALGYSIGAGTKYLTITEGSYTPFRAGISKAGIDAVYDQSSGASMYDVIITGTNVETDTELQYRFNRQRAAVINLIFTNV